MKNLLLVFAFLVSVWGLAQTSGTVNLTVRLQNIQTITVNGTNNVLLTYATQSDYLNGVSSYQPNHLNTFSTQNYFVKTNVLQSNVLTTNDVYLNGILQTTAPQTLFTSPAGIHAYDVTYGAKGNYEYINLPKTDYVIQVIYNIEPQ